MALLVSVVMTIGLRVACACSPLLLLVVWHVGAGVWFDGEIIDFVETYVLSISTIRCGQRNAPSSA